jgi:hypothetical protein
MCFTQGSGVKKNLFRMSLQEFEESNQVIDSVLQLTHHLFDLNLSLELYEFELNMDKGI